MTKIPLDPNLPAENSPNFVKQFRFQTDRILRQIAAQLNGLTEGSLSSVHNAMPSAPTAGTYAQGDFIRNSTPSELGSVSSKYIIFGFICVASGSPGTWRECRVLTGN